MFILSVCAVPFGYDNAKKKYCTTCQHNRSIVSEKGNLKFSLHLIF